jgi:hypothetical protein
MVEEKSEAYTRAEKRVEDKLGFYKSLAVYLGVNLVLFLINLFTSPGEWWFYWVLLFWGIGVFFHFLRVFVTGGNACGESQGTDDQGGVREGRKERPTGELGLFSEIKHESLKVVYSRTGGIAMKRKSTCLSILLASLFLFSPLPTEANQDHSDHRPVLAEFKINLGDDD